MSYLRANIAAFRVARCTFLADALFTRYVFVVGKDIDLYFVSLISSDNCNGIS
jgi:hypothetical protein